MPQLPRLAIGLTTNTCRDQLELVMPGLVRQTVEIHKTGHDCKIYAGNLSARRDCGNMMDIVSAYRMILESNTQRKIFNVGSGNSYSLE